MNDWPPRARRPVYPRSRADSALTIGNRPVTSGLLSIVLRRWTHSAVRWNGVASHGAGLTAPALGDLVKVRSSPTTLHRKSNSSPLERWIVMLVASAA